MSDHLHQHWRDRGTQSKRQRHSIAGSRRRKRNRCRPAIEAMEDRLLLSTVYWNNAAGGDWDTASNWKGGALPGPGDDVVIDEPGDVIITHTQNITDTINSLTAGNPLTLSSGTLDVVGALGDTATVSLAGGTLAQATVQTGTTIGTVPNTGGTLSGVTLAGTLDARGGGSALLVDQSLTLDDGLVDLGNYGSLTFSGTQALTGTGNVLFTDLITVNGLYVGGTGSVLTIGSGITVGGQSGQINGQNGSFINDGTIDADESGGGIKLAGAWSNSSSGELEATGGDTLDLTGNWTSGGSVSAGGDSILTIAGTWNNTGTISATSSSVYLGGSFTLADLGAFTRSGGFVYLDGTLNNAGTTLALDDDTGSWLLDNGTISGGMVTTAGAAVLGTTANESGALDGVTLAGTLDVRGGGSGLLINQSLTLDDGLVDIGNYGSLTFSGNQALTGTGNVLFTDLITVNGLYVSGTGAVLTIGPGITVGGQSGQINGQNGSFVNDGTIDADESGGVIKLAGTWSNPSSGNLEANGGDTLNLTGNWTSGGSVAAGGDSVLTIAGTWNNTGTISATSSSVYLGGSFTLADLGAFTRSGGFVYLDGTLNNAGTTLALDDDTGSWLLDNGTISGGMVTTAGAAVLGTTANEGSRARWCDAGGDARWPRRRQRPVDQPVADPRRRPGRPRRLWLAHLQRHPGARRDR